MPCVEAGSGEAMKVTIVYEFDPVSDTQRPYWAKSGGICRSGKNWIEARDRLIHTLKTAQAAKQTVPEPEEVEL